MDNQPESKKPNTYRSLLIMGLFLATAIMIATLLPQLNSQGEEITLTKLATLLEEGAIEKISIKGDDISATLKGNNTTDGSETVVISHMESDISFYETMALLGVSTEAIRSVDTLVEGPNTFTILFNNLIFFVPFLLIGLIVYTMMRSMRSGQDQAMNFGRSRAKMISVDKPLVTFDDVAGIEESKQELEEIVEFLSEPDKFIQLGARVPKGVLMIGPPGTGKTLLARAVAGEAGVPFMSISGSEFVEMFVGVGASRVRDLFNRAKQVAPAIIFVDEIDAVGRMRGTGLGGGHDEREQTLNQILVEMDGFDNDSNVIVIAATNRADVLDPALLRPGRFDRKVYIDRPDVLGREKILEIHARGKPLSTDVELSAMAKLTPGMTGADLENLINEAAILAARADRQTINMSDFQEAMEKMVAGPARHSKVVTPEKKLIVAYHEAGHAVTMYHLENSDPVHKVTIIPRGNAGGYTMVLPESMDSGLITREQFEDELVGLLGGRTAEELQFGRITTGASSDLQRSSSIARSMVKTYGMSEEIGLGVYSEANNSIFLGRSIGESRPYSEETAKAIDKEVNNILNTAHQRATDILTEHRDKLVLLAETLLEIETVDRAKFEELMTSS